MAQPKTLKFSDQVVMLGDGEDPEAFEAPCGFTELGLTVNIETNSVNVPDCDDPDLPSWLVSDEVSKQMQITGNGVLTPVTEALWRDWLLEGGEKNIRWVTQGSGANGGGYYSAPAILTTYEQSGSQGSRWTRNIGLTLNGKPTWTAAA